MALQGTLDTFALADLIRLLATTTKTGELAIDGDRGTGHLWFRDGDLVGGRPAPDGSAEDALFELLRFEEGEFHFAADVAAEDGHAPLSALEVLEAAEQRLADWLPIAALVPSARVSLRLAERLDRDEVTLTPSVWEQLLLVAPGTTAGAFGEALGLAEVAAATAVRDLAELGLVEIGPEVAEDAVAEDAVAEDAVADETDDAIAEIAEDTVIEDTVADVEPELLAEVESEVEPEVEPEALVDDDVETGTELGPDDELLSEASETDAWSEVDETVGLLPADDAEREPTPDEALLETPSWVPWGEPVAFSEDAESPASPLSAAALAALDEVLPMEDDGAPRAEADLEAPELAELDEEATEVEDADVLAALDMLPPVASASRPADGPDMGGDLAVDLDAHLGGAVTGHRYLGGDPGSAALPEPLPLVEPLPVAPETTAPVPEAHTASAPEDAPMASADPVMEGWPGSDAREQELAMQLDALSPAAARAVASAASSGTTAGDSDAGRRVLRRIISSGRG